MGERRRKTSTRSPWYRCTGQCLCGLRSRLRERGRHTTGVAVSHSLHVRSSARHLGTADDPTLRSRDQSRTADRDLIREVYVAGAVV